MMAPNSLARLFAAVMVLAAVPLIGSARGQTPVATVQYKFPLTYGFAASVDTGETANWLGGDAAFFMPVSGNANTQSYWTIGDNFVTTGGSRFASGTSALIPLTGSVLCVGNAQNGSTSYSFYFRGHASNPQPFFADPASPTYANIINSQGGTNGGSHFWPARSFLYNGYLFIIMHRVLDGYVGTASSQSYSYAGTHRGTVIARITNPLALPTSWNIDYLDLTTTNVPAVRAGADNNMYPILGNEAVTANIAGTNSLLIYGSCGGTRNAALAISLDTLHNYSGTNPNNQVPNNVYDQVAWYNSNKNWVSGYSSGTYTGGYSTNPSAWVGNQFPYYDIQLPTSTWFSVRQLLTGTYAGWYQALYVDNSSGNAHPTAMMAALSQYPYDWSNKQTREVALFPEMQPTLNGQQNLDYNPGNQCYPGPGCELTNLSTSATVWFVYEAFGDFNNGDLYRPVIASGPAPVW